MPRHVREPVIRIADRRGIIRNAALCVLCRYRHKTHATGHKSRLDRNFSGRFGTAERSAEELVAELGAAFLCADLNVTPTLRDDHAHYIARWLEIMKGDKKAIFTAAAAANRAVEWLHGKQPPQA